MNGPTVPQTESAPHADASNTDAAVVPPRGSLPRYRASLRYGWVLGDFPVRELLRHAPETALEVRWHGALPCDRKRRIEAACAEAGVSFRRDDAGVEAKRSKGTARTLGCFAKRERSLASDRDHLVLVAPADPGNLGTMLRSALALGVEDVAIVGDADPWSPHVARASLGALFALRVARFATLAAYRATVPDRSVWLLDADAEVTVDDVRPERVPVAVVAGPEWPGLGREALAHGRTVRIATDARVESLNVAVAVGIALHRLRTARTTGGRRVAASGAASGAEARS